MKAKHDIGCGSRKNIKCDCPSGVARKIRKKAKNYLKRLAKKCGPAIEVTGLPTTGTKFTPFKWKTGTWKGAGR